MTGNTDSVAIVELPSVEGEARFDFIMVAQNTTNQDHAEHSEGGHSDAHTEVTHGETSGGMPQFDTTTFANQALWLTITILAIYFILSKIALPRIGGVLEQRSQIIQRDLDRAAELKGKAEAAEESYQQALIDARAKSQQIVSDAKADAQEKLDAAVAKADAQIDAEAKISADKIAKMQSDANMSVAEIAKDVASSLIEVVSPGSADQKIVDKTVDKLVKG